MRFLKNMRGHKFACIVIVTLLFIQALCELSLPGYTANLLDTGIQNVGIEYGVPEKISESSYEDIRNIMTEEEASKWGEAYENYGHMLELTDEAKNSLDELEGMFSFPIALYHMMVQSEADQSEDNMSDDIMGLRMQMEELSAKMGDSMIHSSAVAFVKSEYEKIGVDLQDIQSKYMWKTGGIMLVVAFLLMIVAIVIGYFSSKVAADIGKELREKVFEKVISFSKTEMDRFSTASLITRTTNDIQHIQMVAVLLLRTVAYAPLLAIGGIIMVTRTGSGMEWIIVLAVVVMILLMGLLLAVAMPKFKIMPDKIDDVNLVAREILTGIPVIRAFVREKYEEKRFDVANMEMTKVMLFVNRIMALMMPLITLVMNGICVLIVWVGAQRIDMGILEVGTMTAFITYATQITMSFLMLSMMSVILPRAAVSANRIDEILMTESVVKDVESATNATESSKSNAGTTGRICFENVSFSYPNAEGFALTDINFVAEPGKTTAIIGSTGSGKSTVVQLILRFYDVTKGRITIDGKDIREMAQHDLREQIGYVPQKAVLFSGTIASNICYGNENITFDKMEEASAIAQATEFVEAKNDRYDSDISQGGNNISGGQKQRLSIARAIAKEPKIYIFDDSFSALDFKTDATLRKSLAAKTVDCTVFVVAQRIGTIINAEQIIVLDEGKIAGIGTHKELIKNCDVYRQIAESQLSLEEIENSIVNSEKEEK